MFRAVWEWYISGKNSSPPRFTVTKISALTKLIALADNSVIVAEIVKFVFENVESIVEKGENAGYQHFPLFSSPDHNVLRMSYCDRSLSGIRPAGRVSVRPWTITEKIFSAETGQLISIKLHRNDPLVMHFQKTSKIWIPWTLVAMATERKNFKNLLVPNYQG